MSCEKSFRIYFKANSKSVTEPYQPNIFPKSWGGALGKSFFLDRPNNQASWELLYLILCGFLETETLVIKVLIFFITQTITAVFDFFIKYGCVVMSLFLSSHEDLKYFWRQMRAAPYYVTVKLENY